jgi:inhibitor of KinA sporulation pathway (predicted exonuclease)
MCVETKETFNSIIDPNPTLNVFPKPPIKELFHLTRSFLKRNKALTFEHVFPKIVRWVHNRSKPYKPILISHGNFCSDKKVLEKHIWKYHLTLPSYWMFFDSLYYFRDYYKTNDYSLKGLVQSLLRRKQKNAHRAYYDVKELYNCIHTFTPEWNLKGIVYSPFITSLRTIRGVGAKAEQLFFMSGYLYEEQLNITLNSIINTSINNGNTPLQTLQDFCYHVFGNGLSKQAIHLIMGTLMTRNISVYTFNNIFQR